VIRLANKLFSTALFWSYATTFLRFGGILLVLPVVLRTIHPEELGLFYVFQTLSIFATLLDIGLSPTIARSVSFAWAGARKLECSGHDILSEGKSDSPNWALLSSLFNTFRKFYWFAAFVLLLILGVGCLPYIWKITATLTNPSEGRSIWLFLCFGACWNFAGAIWPTMLGGMNKVREQQVAQLVAIVSGYAVTIAGLLLGFGLWALAASAIFQAITLRQIAQFLCRREWRGKDEMREGHFDKRLFITLWPASWRTGLIGGAVSIYLSAPVFVTSMFCGLNEAAEVGLSMQLALTVAQVAAVAILVKAPMLSILRVDGNLETLRDLFIDRTAIYITLFLSGMAGVLLFGDWLLHAVVKSRTPLPHITVLFLVFAYVGIEGLQALFRGLALAANITRFWAFVVFGGTAAVVSGAWASAYGLVPFLLALLWVKFVLVDVFVIREGASCISLSFNSFQQVPARLLATLRRK